jgi:hypothetical protein
MENNMINATPVPDSKRGEHVNKIFGARWTWFESYCFDTASSLCADYAGGLWGFFALSNSGFYLAPSMDKNYRVHCANGFDGVLSAQAFGVTACLYSFSLLSFSPDESFARLCADQYHALRAYASTHAEAKAIFLAID